MNVGGGDHQAAHLLHAHADRMDAAIRGAAPGAALRPVRTRPEPGPGRYEALLLDRIDRKIENR
jgi:hypothetical protein